MSEPVNKAFIFAVEHLDPEIEEWSKLEYITIAKEAEKAKAEFWLTSFNPTTGETLSAFDGLEALRIKHESVETLLESRRSRVCLLDPAASEPLVPEDGKDFDIFLFGGILGDDPPRDRTSELRKMGYTNRNLGPKQMTTDTAVRVTRMVVQDQVQLNQIKYVDYPELKVDEHESVEMPFRYVQGPDGAPVMPQGMLEQIKKDSEKGIKDLL